MPCPAATSPAPRYARNRPPKRSRDRSGCSPATALSLSSTAALSATASRRSRSSHPPTRGPDLSWAPDDVRTRFNKTVEEFLFEPTGTMKIILESQIVLTDEQKWEAIDKIMKAYDIVKNREADAAP